MQPTTSRSVSNKHNCPLSETAKERKPRSAALLKWAHRGRGTGRVRGAGASQLAFRHEPCSHLEFGVVQLGAAMPDRFDAPRACAYARRACCGARSQSQFPNLSQSHMVHRSSVSSRTSPTNGMHHLSPGPNDQVLCR